MTQESILLVGAGGHARACIDVIEQEGRFTVVGLVGLPNEVGSRVLGYPVLGTDADLPALLGDYPHALVTVGQIKTPEPRIRLFDLLQQNLAQHCIAACLCLTPRLTGLGHHCHAWRSR